MKITTASNKARATTLLVCIVGVGLIVLGGIIVYVIWKACDSLPPPQPPRAEPATNGIDIYITGAPAEGKAFLRAGLVAWNGSNQFVLTILKTDKLPFERPTVYYLTGNVDRAAGTAVVTAYDTNGCAVSSNLWSVTNSP